MHERRANLIKGGNAPGADAAHSPEVGHLFSQAQINLGGEGAAKCASVKQRAHATEGGDQRAAARLGWVRSENGQITDLSGCGPNLCRGEPDGGEIGKCCVKTAGTWCRGRVSTLAELRGAAALLNETRESEAQRECAHDALDLVVLLSRGCRQIKFNCALGVEGLTEASNEWEPLLLGQGLFEDLIQQLEVVHDPPLSRRDAADGSDSLRATRRALQRPSC